MTVLASPCLIIKRDAPRIYSVTFFNERVHIEQNYILKLTLGLRT